MVIAQEGKADNGQTSKYQRSMRSPKELEKPLRHNKGNMLTGYISQICL